MTLAIALSGSAGTGKSTLGRRLARELGLPFIAEGMRARLQAGLDLHALGPEGWRGLCEELWHEHAAHMAAARRTSGGFVADRSSLDFAAFWLHYGLYEDVARTDAFMQRMRTYAQTYDRILVFPWGVLDLEADGIRSSNRWLQLRFQSLVEDLSRRFAPRLVTEVPPTSDLDERLAFVLDRLRAAGLGTKDR